MRNGNVFIMMVVVMLMVPALAMAEQPSWGSALKAVGQAAGQAAVQQLCPQAQTTLDEAKQLKPGVTQENFLVAKAREFLAAGNYQPAFDLANYVVTTVNSKSVDARKIMADAKAALMKMAQDKLAQTQQANAAAQQGQAQVNAAQQVKADATQTVTGIKNLFGSQK